MGADLTAEYRVLGDHDDDFQRSMKDVLRTDVPCGATAEVKREADEACGNRRRQAGLAGGRRRRIPGVPRASSEHETSHI